MFFLFIKKNTSNLNVANVLYINIYFYTFLYKQFFICVIHLFYFSIYFVYTILYICVVYLFYFYVFCIYIFLSVLSIYFTFLYILNKQFFISIVCLFYLYILFIQLVCVVYLFYFHIYIYFVYTIFYLCCHQNSALSQYFAPHSRSPHFSSSLETEFFFQRSSRRSFPSLQGRVIQSSDLTWRGVVQVERLRGGLEGVWLKSILSLNIMCLVFPVLLCEKNRKENMLYYLTL